MKSRVVYDQNEGYFFIIWVKNCALMSDVRSRHHYDQCKLNHKLEILKYN